MGCLRYQGIGETSPCLPHRRGAGYLIIFELVEENMLHYTRAHLMVDQEKGDCQDPVT